jgi:hypothetical protein
MLSGKQLMGVRAMYSVEFFGSDGGTVERIVLGMLRNVAEAEQQANRLFPGAKLRLPSVVGYRVLDNDGNEVARMRAVHA